MINTYGEMGLPGCPLPSRCYRRFEPGFPGPKPGGLDQATPQPHLLEMATGFYL